MTIKPAPLKDKAWEWTSDNPHFAKKDVAAAVEWLKARIKLLQSHLDDNHTHEDTLMGSDDCLTLIDEAFADVVSDDLISRAAKSMAGLGEGCSKAICKIAGLDEFKASMKGAKGEGFIK